jgi:hypothetical protein
MTVKELIVALLETADSVDFDSVSFSFSDPSGENVINTSEVSLRVDTGTLWIENL